MEANETTVSTAYPGYNWCACTQLNVVLCCESNQLVISLTGLTLAVIVSEVCGVDTVLHHVAVTIPPNGAL